MNPPLDTRHLALLDDEHLRIEKVFGEPILVVRRKATQPEAKSVQAFVGRIAKAFDRIDRTRHTMLVDLRAATLRSGPELDEALEAFRVEVTRDVWAIARLVTSSVGALQGQRDALSTRRLVRSFREEDEAMAWLRELIAQRKDAAK